MAFDGIRAVCSIQKYTSYITALVMVFKVHMYHCFNALLNRSENNYSSDHTNAALKKNFKRRPV